MYAARCAEQISHYPGTVTDKISAKVLKMTVGSRTLHQAYIFSHEDLRRPPGVCPSHQICGACNWKGGVVNRRAMRTAGTHQGDQPFHHPLHPP